MTMRFTLLIASVLTIIALVATGNFLKHRQQTAPPLVQQVNEPEALKSLLKAPEPPVATQPYPQTSRTVLALLNDPESARFQNVRPAAKAAGFICGEVNAKNRYGGYVGFREFVADGQSALIDSAQQDADHLKYILFAHEAGCN
jgi:hypothetical protein